MHIPDPEPTEVTIARLEANQRTPGTVEMSRRWLIVIAIIGVVTVALAAINLVGILTYQHADPARPGHAAVVASPADAMSDRQFAEQFNAILDHLYGYVPVTVARVPEVVDMACDQGNIYGVLLPPADWHKVQALLVKSGRCSR